MNILNEDAFNYNFGKHDMIFTDPPYEFSGEQLKQAFDNVEADHLVMLCTMSQLIELIKCSNWQLRFDFVWDFVAPKKAKQWSQPHYTHSTGVYLTRNNAKSAFSRKNETYFPTIIRANKQTSKGSEYKKNQEATTHLMKMFDVDSVIDIFAGSGTSGFSAIELNKSITLNDVDKSCYDFLNNAFSYFK